MTTAPSDGGEISERGTHIQPNRGKGRGEGGGQGRGRTTFGNA